MAKHDGSGFAWFLAGMALGIAGALLTAPHSGEETRRQLREQAAKSRERLQAAGRTAAGRGRSLMDEAAESGRKVYERGQELYRKGRSLAEETATELGKKSAAPLSESTDKASEA